MRHYGKEYTEELRGDMLPITCHCGHGGTNVETGKRVDENGMCIITGRDEPEEGELYATFKGFFRDDPKTGMKWHAPKVSMCKKNESDRRKLKKNLDVLECLEKINVGDPKKPLFPYAVSSVETGMATSGIHGAVKECFEDSGEIDDTALSLGERCSGRWDKRFQESPSDMKEVCDQLVTMQPPFGLLKDIDEEAEKSFDDDAYFVFSKLFEIGTSLGSRIAMTPYTRWSGD